MGWAVVSSGLSRIQMTTFEENYTFLSNITIIFAVVS